MHICFSSIIYKKEDKSKGFRLFAMRQGTEIILEQFLKRTAIVAKRNFNYSIFTAKTVRILYIPDKIPYPFAFSHGCVDFDVADVNQILDVYCLNICLT